jgi:polygalacturonase
MLLSCAAFSATAIAATTQPSVFDIFVVAAIPGGKPPAKSAIQNAIDAAAAAGGGQVFIRPGTYLTGPIHLASGIDLHVDAGAVVIFSKDWTDYPVRSTPADDGGHVRISPITAQDLHDISITGTGTFDGQGQAWRPIKRVKMSEDQWRSLTGPGGHFDAETQTWYPSSDPNISKERPVLVYLANCRNVLLDGPTFRNSPNWNLHPFQCSNVTIRHVTIFNPTYAQNGDGIDIDSCSNLTMSDCLVNAGDDAICLKSGTSAAGHKQPPAENILITRCTIGSGHGGITIGSEMSGGVRNVTVSHCQLTGTDAGLRFKTERGRGGVVENITISDITMSEIQHGAIEFDMFYGQKRPPSKAQAVSDRTPQFRNFQISRVSCDGAQTALVMRGLPEMPLRGISLDDVQIHAQKAGEIDNADDLTLKDIQIVSESDTPVLFKDVHDLKTDHVQGLSDSR